MRISLLLLILGLVLAACSGPGAPTRASLEARVLENPDDVEALQSLGAFLALEGEYSPAVGPLTRARREAPTDGRTLYLLGLVHEALGDSLLAEQVYGDYLRVEDAYRDSLRGRLDALRAPRLRREAARALAAEDSTGDILDPEAIGVLPFAYRGTDEQYAPLGRGFAEVLAVDLASVSALTVVERARLQALLAEFDLASSGALDPSTAPRTGRFLRAGRLIGGEVDVRGDAIRAEASLYQDSLQTIGATEGELEELFRLQRALTADVLRALGVAPPQVEAAQAREAPTDDLTAFLIFSRALLRQDNGDLVGARALFDEALARDPDFRLASQARREIGLAVTSQTPAVPVLTGASGEILTETGIPGSGPGDLVRRRAENLGTQVGRHVSPSEETREPGVEGSRAGILGPLPDPPPPPSRAGGQ